MKDESLLLYDLLFDRDDELSVRTRRQHVNLRNRTKKDRAAIFSDQSSGDPDAIISEV